MDPGCPEGGRFMFRDDSAAQRLGQEWTAAVLDGDFFDLFNSFTWFWDERRMERFLGISFRKFPVWWTQAWGRQD